MTYQKINRTLFGAMVVAGMMGVASQAQALTFNSGSEDWHSVQLSALDQSDVETLVGAASGSLGLVYKQDNGGSESGNGAGFYTTLFNNDASGGTITWGGSMKISCPACYLVVKDGNHDANNPPPWPQYVFDLSSWNGTDTITLSGFWPQGGSISHIAIWNNAEAGGGSIAAIPEPETYAMLLAGLGLVGFAARRKLS